MYLFYDTVKAVVMIAGGGGHRVKVGGVREMAPFIH
jgi:hypothetical protein